MNTYDQLKALAWNLWWSWNPEVLDLFERLDGDLFRKSGNNPVAVLRTLDPNTVWDERFVDDVRTAFEAMQEYLETPGGLSGARRTSYFCMEFGLHESLATYAGGLGILAGDHAKAASDLGLPFTAVGLFLKEGYLQQHLTEDGWQRERYPRIDPANHPLELVRTDDGEPRCVTVHFGNTPLRVQAWRIRLGRTALYLLDADRQDNPEELRGIVARLYQGDTRTRLRQEIVLGIGGVRLLRALGVETDVYHLNEGHCAFLTLELLREELAAGRSREEAVDRVRQRCVFTTHTPVLVGHDRFDADLFLEDMNAFRHELGLSKHDILAFGRTDPYRQEEPFTMTVLGLRLSRNANGVSQCNGHVAREQWHAMFPGRPLEEVPIGAITNGVHVPTWAVPTAHVFLDEHLGNWKRHVAREDFWQAIDDIPDEALWTYRNELRRQLVRFATHHAQRQSLPIACALDPDALTIGFARRFATYKRAPLLFHDVERVASLFSRSDRPMQILYAGKSHPENNEGKQFIRRITEAAHHPGLKGRVVFLENYDMEIGRMLVSGCDVWLNNPRIPMEASGTSGQKIAVHGGLNLSILDGWWPEGYDGYNGWAIDDSRQHRPIDPHEQDRQDVERLYQQLETAVAPAFYERDERGIPTQWVGRMRAAMKALIARFSAIRMVTDYAERMYGTLERCGAP